MNKVALVAVFLLVFGYAQMADAQEFGVVMDVSGKVELQAKGKNSAIDLGKNVSVGDNLSIGDKGRVTLVAYKGCEEWEITGPGTVHISDKIPELEKGSKGKASMKRKLPVCYKPEDMKVAGSHEQGGLVLMNKAAPVDNDNMEGPNPAEMSGAVSAEDEMEPLRRDFGEGKADNATLMTLVMHDLKKNDTEGARPYFMELKKRAPGSEFVKKLGKDFGM